MEENWYAVEHEVREQLRRARAGMWKEPYLMDPYLEVALRYETIAEARRQVARERLLHRVAPTRMQSRCRVLIHRLVRQLVQAIAVFRPNPRVDGRVVQ